jgi:hypothetical protein
MFHRLLDLRMSDEGANRGAVLTGQPGTGASQNSTPYHSSPARRFPGKVTFLNFMLARLISAGQVVLACSQREIHLFYRGKVYIRPMAPGFLGLPQWQNTEPKYSPVWALTNVGSELMEQPINSIRMSG